MLGLLPVIFSQIITELWLLIDVIESHQILYTHLYWQYLGWDLYLSYFTYL